ncbi:hypothetical protein PPL_12283 [Heterostelium album PN500]|uniref:Uncharacterized protein n=1 Tax=Heterostelium pallidum (strain ATCC 26659 / Pp 5 / PN500) TaxID=670386 RepID=D3BM74_HETP5|nr:hypothetical protein PPL_12283 [Heterostelium album PN500]EFA77675.1 hypothetical protein PPL_12283 [Heterostelium album PN500]|eukprot:XP_020429803.1 hypothetical protein PPL_12283 [Heterostelium album PN500]
MITANIYCESECITFTSKGSDIKDDYIKQEYQEEVIGGPFHSMIKEILSIQELTNKELTVFVNKDKETKMQQQASEKVTSLKRNLEELYSLSYT